MLISKLASGVLRVLTPLGPRYIKPSFKQRLYLLWTFRHFEVLPLQVLSPRQRQLIEELCAQQRFVSLTTPEEADAPVLGTVERRPPIESEPQEQRPGEKKAAAAVVNGLRQRS